MTLTPSDRESLLRYVLTIQALHGRATDAPPYSYVDAELATGGLMSRRPPTRAIYLGSLADPLDARPARRLRATPLRCGRYTLTPRVTTAGTLARAGRQLFEARLLSIIVWNAWRFDRLGVDPARGWTRGAA